MMFKMFSDAHDAATPLLVLIMLEQLLDAFHVSYDNMWEMPRLAFLPHRLTGKVRENSCMTSLVPV